MRSRSPTELSFFLVSRKEKERGGILRHKKRVTGRFRYEVTVSSDIDENAVSASLSDGKLRVRLPKTAADQRRRIEITWPGHAVGVVQQERPVPSTNSSTLGS